MRQDFVRKSKLLSLVLRHDPSHAGIQLDSEGWVAVDALLAGLATRYPEFTRALLEEIVATNDKRRFVLSPDGTRIRAAQGHSIDVDLGLEPAEPPARLFHGTASRNLDSIRAQGLVPRGRHHVHLSVDERSAMQVGARHGKPVVLAIDAGAMARAGRAFYLSENDVWLADEVPPAFIRFPEHS